jgi:hypothetical protein
MTRTVKVVSTRLNKVAKIETSAKTKAELEKDLKAAGIDYSGMHMMVKDTRCSLELDESVLPEGDFTVMILAKKMKSGVTKKVVKKPVKKATPAKKPVKKAAPVAKKKVTKKAPKEIEDDDNDDQELLKEAKNLEQKVQKLK